MSSKDIRSRSRPARCSISNLQICEVAERSRNMSKSMPSRARTPAVEGATAATPKRSVEQFRLHLLERIPDAASEKLRGVNSGETAAGNGLREIWEKSDLPAGKFADEAASFWRVPRFGPLE